MTGPQNAQLCGDLSHRDPFASCHRASSNQQAEGNGATLGSCTGSGQDKATGGGAGDQPLSLIRILLFSRKARIKLF